MELAIYFLKVTICLLVFGSIYQVFLRRLTFFALNRCYLLLTLIVSFSIPTLRYEVKRYQIVERVVSTRDISIKAISDTGHFDEEEAPESNRINWEQLVLMGYYLVSTALFLRFLLYLNLIRSHVINYGIRNAGVTLTKPIRGLNNCSFFNVVFIDTRHLPVTELNQILAHEQEHMKRVHSADKVMLELLRIVMWFNPLIYYYRSVINEVHEFEVDAAMTSDHDKQDYANLLLKLSTPASFSVSNSFSSNPLSTRIKMLFTNQSKAMKKVIYLAILPVIFGLVWYLSVDVVYAKIYQSPQNDKVKSLKKAGSVAILKADKPDSDVIERGNIKARSVITTSENVVAKIETDKFPDLSVLSENNPLENSTEKPNIRVVLDPGHGGKDDNAQVNGVYEKDLNLDVALEIRKQLQEKGFEVIMTRENDSYVPLITRAGVKGDIFISIHAGRVPSDSRRSWNGMKVFVGNTMPKDPALLDKSTILAKVFQNELGKITGIKMSDQIRQIPSMVLRINTSPSILVELGYMTDENDLKFMLNKDNHRKIAHAFVEAIEAYQ